MCGSTRTLGWQGIIPLDQVARIHLQKLLGGSLVTGGLPTALHERRVQEPGAASRARARGHLPGCQGHLPGAHEFGIGPGVLRWSAVEAVSRCLSDLGGDSMKTPRPPVPMDPPTEPGRYGEQGDY